ncbi:Alpha/beta-hydrolase lipase region [Tyrophagus putrescentiae]|nr:Alpha/beta-hydrolase lipase region [Tyrophagus putrescentiae]
MILTLVDPLKSLFVLVVFDIEVHNVITKDGYILALHRLVNRKERLGLPEDYYHYSTIKKPVLIQHGIFSSSIEFLINSPFLENNNSKSGDNLGFGLHMTGRYDVFLSNTRGSLYSQKHVKFSNQEDAFWRYSFDHMAEFDLPAVIDYIKKITSSETVAYVGFSQGTAIMFALMSLRPEYGRIVRPFIAMAPITTVSGVQSPIPSVSIRQLALVMSLFLERPHQFTIPAWLSGVFWKSTHLNESRVSVYSQHASSVGSWELLHWAQLVISRRFERFDYRSRAENAAKYGQATVPDFPLQAIPREAVIALIRSDGDEMSTVPDQERLIAVLKKAGVALDDYVIPASNWSHADYLHGLDAGRLIYDHIIELLDRFTL